MLKIRNYEEGDAPFTWEIFYHTIRNVNILDYSQAQVEAWAPDGYSLDSWRKQMGELTPFIADLNGQVVGYADLQEDGHIDHFFVHAEYQGHGIGRKLMEHIMATGTANHISRYYSEVSITARPFYEHFGFQVVKEQQIETRGQILTNFVMEKSNSN